MSTWFWFFEVVSEASVFARARNRGDGAGGEPNGEDVDGDANAGCEGDRDAEWSELYEREREDIGTVRLLRLRSDNLGSDPA